MVAHDGGTLWWHIVLAHHGGAIYVDISWWRCLGMVALSWTRAEIGVFMAHFLPFFFPN